MIQIQWKIIRNVEKAKRLVTVQGICKKKIIHHLAQNVDQNVWNKNVALQVENVVKNSSDKGCCN